MLSLGHIIWCLKHSFDTVETQISVSKESTTSIPPPALIFKIEKFEMHKNIDEVLIIDVNLWTLVTKCIALTLNIDRGIINPPV